MKRTQDIIGLPVVSISEGREVGHVKNVIINSEKGTIDYFIVDSGVQILSARVISTERVVGIGEYAITIENENSINDIGKIPAAIELLRKNIEIKGAKVLTTKGQLIGEIGEFFFDKDTFRVIGLEYIADITQKKSKIIPRESVVTFGVNFVIVSEDIEEALVEQAEQINKISDANRDEKTHGDRQQVNNYASIILQDLSETNKEIDGSMGAEEIISDMYKETEGNESQKSDNAAELFEQKQRQYLLDRHATKTILGNDGNVIINEGEKITEEVIDTAKLHGKLIELVMNNKA